MDERSEVDEGKVELMHLAGRPGPQRAAAGASGWGWRLPDGEARPLAGDVRFHDVTFGYVPGTCAREPLPVCQAGPEDRFVGSTGAGKTTITNLINRFYEVGAARSPTTAST